MKSILISFMLLLSISSCNGPRYVDYFPYYDNGREKPRVALLPIIDSSQVHLPWNLATELNAGIRYEAMNDGVLFLPDELDEFMSKMGKISFFGSDEKIAQAMCEADFAVIIELMEHDYLPTGPQCSQHLAELTVRMRIKVLDLRRKCPRVILQEVFADKEFVPPVTGDNLNPSSFWMVAIKKAHRRMICNITHRIEDIILSAY